MQPSLDYYVGRAVEKVKESPDGWDIVLEGGVSVTNLDGRRKIPGNEIKGLTFFGPIESSEANLGLEFGTVMAGRPPRVEAVIDLTRDNFRINDPRFAEIEDTPSAEDSLPEDPSTDRAVDEPQVSEIEPVEETPVPEPEVPGPVIAEEEE